MPNQHSLPSPKEIYKQTVELIEKERIFLLFTRGNVESLTEASQVAKENGFKLIGLDFRIPGVKQKLKSLKRQGSREYGVFNITSKKQARIGINAGARFLFSTHLDKGIVRRCRKEKVFHAIGSVTPTEVFNVLDLKADAVSIFPCSKVGGLDWFQFLKEIFPKAKLIPSDHMNPNEAKEYLDAEAFGVAVIIDLQKTEDLRKTIKDYSFLLK